MIRPALLAIVLSLSATQAIAADPDGRTPLRLTPGERAFVSEEMRGFLSATQTIAAALARNDLKAAADAARPMGMAAGRHTPPSLRAKLPAAFRELGRATHLGFDNLARDAESMGDANLALGQLGEVMSNCVACHAMFRGTEQRR